MLGMQIDLSVNTALPLALEGIELRFGADVEPVAPTVRLAGGEMRELFMHRPWWTLSSSFILCITAFV